MDGYTSFGYWVRRRRKALDLTQSDLARQVFCALSTIKKIELDERRPSRHMAERLADCLFLQGTERDAFLAASQAELAPYQLLTISSPIFPRLQPSNLPPPQLQTPFVGYENELAQLTALLQNPNCRLITLVGPGGIGKTRLAIQAASGQAGETGRYPDGVYFVPLAPLHSPEFIHLAILETLKLQVPPAQPPRAFLLEAMRQKAILMVLDNYERLSAGTELLIELSQSAPEITFLVTSREPLNLRIEHVFEVKGLEYPPHESVQEVESFAALRLFVQTARRVDSEFAWSDENIASAARICRMVEGMPLAIELAASWVRLRTCQEIEGQIERNLDILASTMLDVPERHRSIRAAFDASWYLLSSEEQRVFSELSVFRGGFDLQAAVETAAASEQTLAFLVGKSLLRRAAANRYDLHELLRRCSEEKLEAAGKTGRLRDAHLATFLRLAEQSQAGPGLSERSLEREIDNFRVSLAWALETHARQAGLRLVSALAPFWHEIGYLQEGSRWLSEVLSMEEGQFPAERAAALIQLAFLIRSMGEFEHSTTLTQDALSIFSELKDPRGTGLAMMNMGIISYLEGDFGRGAELLERCVGRFQELGEEQALVEALLRLADLHMRQENLEKAAGLWQEALTLARKLGSPQEVAFSLGGLGDVYRRQGKFLQAVKLHKESLSIQYGEDHKLDVPYALEALAMDYAALGLGEQAALLWGAAEHQRKEFNAPVPPVYEGNYAPVIEAVRGELGTEKFEQAWSQGRSAPLESTIAGLLKEQG